MKKNERRLSKILIFLTLISISSCSLMDYDVVLAYEDQYENELPVFYIHPKPVSRDFYTPVTLIYKGKSYDAEGKIRGGISSYFPKKSYTLKFEDNDLFNDREKGFDDRKKIVLISNFDDNSYIRNRLAFWMWNILDDDFQINPYSGVVYTNGSYEGLYTINEFINENYLERKGFDSSGDMFKGTTLEVDFYMKSNLMSGFEKKTGTPTAGNEGSYDSLESFITNVNELSDTDVVDYFTDNVDVESYYDWWFFASFMKAWDSVGKNAYQYLDPDTNKWYYIPWDFNQSFGQSFNTTRLAEGFDENTYDQNGIFNSLVGNEDVVAFNDIDDIYGIDGSRYKTLLTGDLTTEIITAKVDELYDEVKNAAIKDFSKWEDDYQSFRSILFKWEGRNDYTTVDEEIDYIKDWIEKQHDEFTEVYD